MIFTLSVENRNRGRKRLNMGPHSMPYSWCFCGKALWGREEKEKPRLNDLGFFLLIYRAIEWIWLSSKKLKDDQHCQRID
jgi:hypothetical protein